MNPKDTPQPIPLVTIVHRDRAKAKNTVKEVLDILVPLGFDRQRLRDEYDIEQADWLLHQESALGTDPTDWIALCRRFLQRAQGLEKIEGDRHFHAFLDCPAALAMGLGASLGTRYQVSLYHRKPPYVRVAEIPEPARFKASATSPFQYITVDSPECWTADVLVSMQLSGYSPEAFLRAESAGHDLALVVMNNNYDNALSLEADWFQVALEVVDALRTILNKRSGVKRLHLAFSCPVPLAFAIGMGLGIQPPVRVYNWFSNLRTYVPVFDLDQMRRLDSAPAVRRTLLPPWTQETPDLKCLVQLRQILTQYFNEGELKTLCFDLGVDYEHLPGEGTANKARELVAYFERRGRVPELIDKVRALRPDAPWEEMPA